MSNFNWNIFNLVTSSGFNCIDESYNNLKCLGDVKYVLDVLQVGLINEITNQSVYVGLTKNLGSPSHISIYWNGYDLLSKSFCGEEIPLASLAYNEGEWVSNYDFLNDNFRLGSYGMFLRIEDFNEEFFVIPNEFLFIHDKSVFWLINKVKYRVSDKVLFKTKPECNHSKIRDHSYKMTVSSSYAMRDLGMNKEAFNHMVEHFSANASVCSKKYTELGTSRSNAIKLYKALSSNDKIIHSRFWQNQVNQRCKSFIPPVFKNTNIEFDDDLPMEEFIYSYKNRRSVSKRNKLEQSLSGSFNIYNIKKKNMINFENTEIHHRNLVRAILTSSPLKRKIGEAKSNVLKELKNNYFYGLFSFKDIKLVKLKNKALNDILHMKKLFDPNIDYENFCRWESRVEKRNNCEMSIMDSDSKFYNMACPGFHSIVSYKEKIAKKKEKIRLGEEKKLLRMEKQAENRENEMMKFEESRMRKLIKEESKITELKIKAEKAKKREEEKQLEKEALKARKEASRLKMIEKRNKIAEDNKRALLRYKFFKRKNESINQARKRLKVQGRYIGSMTHVKLDDFVKNEKTEEIYESMIDGGQIKKPFEYFDAMGYCYPEIEGDVKKMFKALENFIKLYEIRQSVGDEYLMSEFKRKNGLM